MHYSLHGEMKNVLSLGNFNPTYLFLFSVASGSVIIQAKENEEEKEKEKTREKEKEKGRGRWKKNKETQKRKRTRKGKGTCFFGGRRKVRKQTLKTKTVGKSFLMRRVEETKSND